MRRLAAVVPLLLVLLLTAAPADAKWFGAETVDGPAPIDLLGGVSLGRDGGGGAVYVKREGDNPAGYLARFVAGAWRAPERVPGADGVSEIRLAAGEKGRLVVVWISGGNVFGAVADGKPGAPLSAPVPLSSGGGASGLDVALGVEGGAYAVWSQSGDVHAAMIEGTTWTPVPGVLDIDPAHVAGMGTGRPRVDVAADDTAVVAWGEQDASGVSHVWYRRLLGTTVSQYPQQASVAAFGGEAGGAADAPEIQVEYDRSFAWVVFREVVGGRMRTLARRLRGSTFDDPVAIDGGATTGGAPALAMNSLGQGIAVANGADRAVVGSLFADDVFRPPVRLDAAPSAADPEPVAAFSDRGDGAVAYRSQGADSIVRGRHIAAGKAEADTVLSAGGVVPGTLRVGADRVGDVAVGMLSGAPGARVLGVALYDLPPSRSVATARARYVNPRTEGITWNQGLDYLGPQRFRVRVDGRTIGTTTARRLRTRAVREGRHRLQIVAIDRRGQATLSRTFGMYVDTHRPRASVSAVRSGRLVRVTVRASDPGKRGAGVRRITVDWGDGHTTSRLRERFSHRYRSGGRKAIVVTVRDRARNETVKRLRR